jgi:hypothetical protein
MSKILQLAENTNVVPTTLADTAANLMKATADEHTPLLKFKKGKYYAGEKEVPIGTKYLAYCANWAQGWVKFDKDEVVERRLGKVADGYVPPEREELDATDKSEWQSVDGTPRDPWVFQNYLPLENVDTGERLLFVSSSIGGKMAIGALCNRYARNIVKGLPTISLGVGAFSSKKYGETLRPDFPIVGWENDRGIVEVTEPKAELNDEIPFCL